MCNFRGYFSRTFQDLKLQFPGLSRSWNFKEKIQDFPGGVGTLLSDIPKVSIHGRLLNWSDMVSTHTYNLTCVVLTLSAKKRKLARSRVLTKSALDDIFDCLFCAIQNARIDWQWCGASRHCLVSRQPRGGIFTALASSRSQPLMSWPCPRSRLICLGLASASRHQSQRSKYYSRAQPIAFIKVALK